MVSIETLIQEGQNAYQNEDYVKAVDIFQRLVAHDSADPNPWGYLGLSLEWLQRYQEAEDALSKAISLAPERPGLYLTRGHIKYRQHKYREAIEDFDLAYEFDDTGLDLGLYDLFLYAGQCHEALGEYQDAITNYKAYASAIGRQHVADAHISRIKEKLAEREGNKTNNAPI